MGPLQKHTQREAPDRTAQLHRTTARDLRPLFGERSTDPFYDCFPVTERQRPDLERRAGAKIDLSHYDYFVQCEGIPFWEYLGYPSESAWTAAPADRRARRLRFVLRSMARHLSREERRVLIRAGRGLPTGPRSCYPPPRDLPGFPGAVPITPKTPAT